MIIKLTPIFLESSITIDSHDSTSIFNFCLHIRQITKSKSMNRKTIFLLIVNLLISISSCFLIKMILSDEKELDDTSKLRFQCFLGVHALFFVSILIFSQIEHLYTYILLGCIDCLLTAVCMYICQKKVSVMQSDLHYNWKKQGGNFDREELTYLNIYFMVYMYSIIGLITFAVFLLSTELLICYEEHTINSNIQHCLQKLEYDQTFKGKECPICLDQFHPNGQVFVQVKICGHIFHEKCLVEWIVRNKTCPLDRKNIFEYESQNQRAG